MEQAPVSKKDEIGKSMGSEFGAIRRPFFWADKVRKLVASPLLHDLPFLTRCRIQLYDERLLRKDRAASGDRNLLQNISQVDFRVHSLSLFDEEQRRLSRICVSEAQNTADSGCPQRLWLLASLASATDLTNTRWFSRFNPDSKNFGDVAHRYSADVQFDEGNPQRMKRCHFVANQYCDWIFST